MDIKQAEKILEQFYKRHNIKPKPILEYKSRPKRIIKNTYDVYVKFKDADNYKYMNTCNTSKTFKIGDTYIKDGNKFEIVDIDKDVLFYKQI